MKIRSPYDGSDLRIKRKDHVLEVGSGPLPNYRSDIIVDRFIESNFHRHDDAKIYAHQKFIHANGEDLPFKDNEFDYIICSHVLEHVDNPALFLKEHVRVAKRGYIEAPSFIGEMLSPRDSHRWAVLEIDKKLVLYDKALINSTFKPDFGNLFLTDLLYRSIALRIFNLTHGDTYTVRYEWNDGVEFLVNPTDEYYSSFFTKHWTPEMCAKIFPRRSVLKEILSVCSAAGYILKCKIKKSLIRKGETTTVIEYLKKNNL